MNERFFKNLKNGVFFDIGAHDGVSLSNTYFFEKELGWSGICLEPIPEVFERLKKIGIAFVFEDVQLLSASPQNTF